MLNVVSRNLNLIFPHIYHFTHEKFPARPHKLLTCVFFLFKSIPSCSHALKIDIDCAPYKLVPSKFH